MKLHAKNHQGWSTLYVLFAIVVISIAIGVCMSTTATTLKFIQRGRDYTDARLAAEGAVEYAWGAWKNNIQANGRAMTTSEATALVNSGTLLETLSGSLRVETISGSNICAFKYDTGTQGIGSCSGTLQIQAVDAYGVPTTSGTPATVPTTLAAYPGWTAYVLNYVASVRLVSSNTRDNPNLINAGAKRTFQYVTVPIFEAMFYFQDDLEIYDPATMTVGGLVHTNSNLYLSQGSSPLTFTDNVSFSGTYYPGYGGGKASTGTSGVAPPGAVSWYNSTMSTPTYQSAVTEVPEQYPLGTGTSSSNSVLDANSNNPNINGGLHELIEPEFSGTNGGTQLVAPNACASGTADPSQIADYRLYNKAGLVINISGTTVTVNGYDGEGGAMTLTPSQVANIQKAVTSGTLYDARQGKTEDIATLDIGALSTVITGSNSASQLMSGSFNGIVYVYHTPANSTTPSGTNAVRLKNGSKLPGGTSATNYYKKGLSIVSANPIYVQGDYNTGGTGSNVPTNTSTSGTASPTASGYTRVPAAVMGDAVMFLSNSWQDQTSSNYNEGDASNTTYNTAILAGAVLSTSTNYSGGANNFPRFLENWSGNTCTYYGSMAELYTSKYYTAPWAETNSVTHTNVYSPPTRIWKYDPNFDNPNLQPPGTLYVYSYTRGPWQKF